MFVFVIDMFYQIFVGSCWEFLRNRHPDRFLITEDVGTDVLSKLAYLHPVLHKLTKSGENLQCHTSRCPF